MPKLDGGIFDSVTVLLEKAYACPDSTIIQASFTLYDTDLEIFQSGPPNNDVFLLLAGFLITKP